MEYTYMESKILSNNGIRFRRPSFQDHLEGDNMLLSKNLFWPLILFVEY